MVLDTYLIKTNAKNLLRESSSERPNFINEIKYLNSINHHTLNLAIKLKKVETKEIAPLKSFCQGLSDSLVILKALKQNYYFRDIVRLVNNIIVISLTLVEDPIKAKEEFGNLADIKVNLIASLITLSKELKEVSINLKDAARAATLTPAAA